MINTLTATQEFIEQGMPGSMGYEEYREKNRALHEEGKTTGHTQTEQYLHYSVLNEQRMRRLDKTVKLNEEIIHVVEQLETQTWLVLTEAWCGDAAQNIPVLKKMADLNPKIELKLILRDVNDPIMQEHLTNGGKSIPKLIAFNAQNEVLFSWGPRPAPVQKMMIDYKNQPEPKAPYSELSLEVQRWYNKDKTVTFQQEMLDLLQG